jgi:hypothetical protein
MFTTFLAVGLLVLVIGAVMGVITIPDKTAIRPTIEPLRLPATPKSAMLNPGPVRIPTAGASSSGTPLVERCQGTRVGYYGFSIGHDLAAGAGLDLQAQPVIRHCIVDGFSGVSPGLDVFVDAGAPPSPEGVFSGLTHTVPAGGAGERIGVGLTTTKIYFE